jgi:hypothetical protein
MENFNKMLDTIKNKGTEVPDTDSDTGSFGNVDAEGVAPAGEEKLVLHVDGGIEIHIPTAVFNAMSAAMNGVEDTPSPCDAIAGGGALEADGETEEPATDDEKKDCPFDKKDDSDSEDKEEKDDDDKDDPVEEGCAKHKKKKGKK